MSFRQISQLFYWPTSLAHLLCCLPLGEDAVPQEVILGEAERVSENLSDAQCYKKKKRGEREGWREGKERDRGRERGENKKKKNSRHNLHKHGFSRFHLSLELLLSNMTMPTGYVYFSLLEGFLSKCNTSLESACWTLGTLAVAAWWRHHASQRWNVDSSKRKDAFHAWGSVQGSEHEEAIETSSANGC